VLGFALPQFGQAARDDLPRFASAADATVTTTARLGSSVFVVPWYPPAQLANHVNPAMLSGQRRLIDDAAIRTHVRINVREGSQVAQVADAVRLLADNGHPDAFVDVIYVATGTDSQLEWVERLLAP
jgi:hypothetical protein